jgi:hypothetical protein
LQEGVKGSGGDGPSSSRASGRESSESMSSVLYWKVLRRRAVVCSIFHFWLWYCEEVSDVVAWLLNSCNFSMTKVRSLAVSALCRRAEISAAKADYISCKSSFSPGIKSQYGHNQNATSIITNESSAQIWRCYWQVCHCQKNTDCCSKGRRWSIDGTTAG